MRKSSIRTLPEIETVEVPRAALVLIIDKSGSMEGKKIQMARAAAIATAGALTPDDYLGILAFDAEPYWVMRPTAAKGRRTVIRQISRLVAGGDTFLYPALEEAHRSLAALEDAHLKHAIILSDGATRLADHRALVERMVTDRISVSTIGIGPDYDRHLLPRIARWGRGRFVSAIDPSTIPRYVLRDATRVLRIFERSELLARAEEEKMPPAEAPLPEVHLPDPEAPATPSPSPPLDPEKKTSTDSEDQSPVEVHWRVVPRRPTPGLAGLQEPLPELTGLNRSIARPGVEVHLAALPMESETDREETPLLAASHHGLGQVMQFASGVGPTWGAAWIAWGPYGRFWAQTVRWIATERVAPAARVRLQTTDWARRRVRLFLENGRGEPISGAGLALKAVDANGDPIETVVTSRGGGLYQVEFARAPAGTPIRILPTALVPDPTPLPPLTIQPPPESEWLGLIEPTDPPGTPVEIDLATRPVHRETEHPDPIGNPLLSAALGLLAIELLARRLLSRTNGSSGTLS